MFIREQSANSNIGVGGQFFFAWKNDSKDKSFTNIVVNQLIV